MTDFSLISNTPRRARQGNELVALRALRRFGALSRADLARKMGLNRSSSGHIIAELISSGLVREVSTASKQNHPGAARGRPGILLELVPEAAYFLGIEIGVEHITTALIDLTAAVVDLRQQPFEGGSTSVEDAIAQSVALALSMCSAEMKAKLEGVGFSVPAQMNNEGFIFHAPLLRWHEIRFLELAKTALPADIPIAVENDANAFAIGELYQSGTTQGVILFLVIESGVGGGLLIDGKLFRGGNGLAGEIGHLVIRDGDDGERTLESVIGLEKLLSRYRVQSGKKDISVASFIKDVCEREPVAVTLADEWAKYLGFALVQAGRIIDPNRIVLGGSMAALYDLVSVRVHAYVEKYQDTPFPLPEIVLDKSAESGSAFGAACILHQKFLSLA
ncbi:hypothetical protein BTJ39_02790 [Izhakiella australiensis]|uniref:Sugar kinase n=1 Tax=Izhakiella australiensis TaxID=1926881 RepID=A0A1S8YTD0_9GAMM|nr:ROK family transcriptional regulator [Izhakiella australiensis]OON42098.1 hypothetical protein BTJ39_02790 [Izhakiella australiensis]